MATLYAKSGGGSWTAAGTWSATSSAGVDNAGPPTAADDTIFDAGSGNVTIDSGAVARSINCTGYTGTLTHTAGVTLTLGDATAGASNIALKLVSGMTYTLGNATTSAISFVSTSATVQTIDFGGKTCASVTFNGAGGSWQLTSAMTNASTAVVTLTAGTLNTNGQTCSWGDFQSDNSNTRNITAGASSITISGANGQWNTLTTTGLTQSLTSSTITFTGGGGYVRSTGTFGNIVWSAATSGAQSQGFTCTNLTITSTAIKNAAWNLASNPTITGTFTATGNSTVNRLLIFSSVAGTARTITCNGSVSMTNVDFQDITAAGSASWNLSAATGGSGDCGGNTGITFTTAAAQTWSGTSGGNWSANAWTTRVPLPQDDVTINAAFSASQTVTSDMPRMGKSIDWTGATGSPTWASGGSFNINNFGSLTLISGMTLSHSAAYILGGRSATYSLTTAGKTFTSNMNIQANGGTYNLQDSFTGNFALSLLGGTFNTNGNTLTFTTVTSQNSATTFNAGASTINLTTTATANALLRTNSAVMTMGAGTINIVNASANTRTLAISALTAPTATINYTVAGSTGPLVLIGPFTIGTINFSDSTNARTLLIQQSTAVTVAVAFNVNGASGRNVTIAAANTSGVQTAGTAASLSKSSGYVSCDYLTIQDSTATGGASWYAGANSTNVSNNTGWFFQAYTSGKFFELM